MKFTPAVFNSFIWISGVYSFHLGEGEGEEGKGGGYYEGN